MIDGKAVENVEEEKLNEQIDKENDTEEIAAEEKTEDIQKEEDLTSSGEMAPESEENKDSKTAAKEKKKKRKDKKDEKIEELNDRLLRNMAEFENFRNRSEKEKSLMFEIGAKSVVEKILPVVDNFERGLGAVAEEEKENAFVKGMEAVYKQFSTVLEEIGVVPIEAVGKEFDPNLHNAVMHDEDDSMEANIISEEFQKGYMYKDSVVRHSMVKVVN
ncbi:MAG: nucleotide exchange factor GrpE [Eubacterium sp.]|jgi:Molecular chaperone GrpE (heat shock protein)|nr:nucleotide exchange factor GrpE [Eubacterium sp.]